MKERKGFIFNIGMPSMLLVLLTFILAIFALLSIRASSSELTLADKTGTAVSAYYAADQKAEYTLAYMDSIIKVVEPGQLESMLIGLEAGKVESLQGLQDVSVQLEEKASFVTDTEEKPKKVGTVSFSFPIENGGTLQVAYDVKSDRSYEITRWQVEPMESQITGFGGESVELWDGDVTVEE